MKKDWTYKKLGEVGTVVTGSTPSTKDNMNYSSQDVCFFKPSDLSSDSLVKLSKSEFYISKHAFEHSRKLPKGSVLTTCIGIIGKVGILTEEATCNQQINAIIPNPDIIISDFLGYSIMSKKHILQASANAPVVPLLNKTQFSKLSIPIPPLSIQRSIVSELDLLHSVIEKKQEQLRALDNLAQSLFYQMFGDPITNPMGWEIKKLGEVCVFSQGMQAPIEEQYEECREGLVRFLRIIDFTQGTDAPRYVECKDDKYILHDKEIAIVRYGTPGFVCYGKYGAIANNLFKITPIVEGQLNYSYFIHWLSSDAFQMVVKGNQYGAALQAIKFSTIQNILTILPPLSLQQSFAAKVSAIEEQKRFISQSIKDVESLLAQRMDQYFG